MSKLVSGTMQELFTAVNEFRNDYRQLYFGLTFFHSIMLQRDCFGSIGWKAPYQFTVQDH